MARVRSMSAPTKTDLEDQLKMIRDSQQSVWLLRVNPLLAGCFLMDHQFKYLESGNELMARTSRLRAFCHIYSAARDRKLLDAIPFVEDVIEKYESVLFTPSRAAAVHGAFAKSYLASQSLVASNVSTSISRKRTMFSDKEYTEELELTKSSRLLRLLYLDDYSVLPAELTTTSSWKSLLKAVSDICTSDLFGSRLLSRDLLKFHDDVTDLFFSLRDELCRQSQFEKMVIDAGGSRDQAISRALENLVVFPLLPLLDSLGDDGSTGPTKQIAGLGRFGAERQRPRAFAQSISGGLSEVVQGYCRHAAAVIARRFGDLSPVEIEKRYFTLPAQPTWATLEFGDGQSPIDTTHDDAVEEFDSLMEMFESCQGPLSSTQLDGFKRRVIANPGMLALASVDPSVELCTLLRHAAAGSAHDRRLVEWLIQMGALDMESPHCQFPEAVEKARERGYDVDLYGNTLAVRSAAERRHTEIVKLLLHGGNLRDLDTTTYRTKDSLVHIAVRTDNIHLFKWLGGMNVDVSRKNAAGKRVWQLTSSPSLRKQILTLDAFQKQQADLVNAQLARGPIYTPGVGSYKLWKSLEKQRFMEHLQSTARNSGSQQTQKQGSKTTTTIDKAQQPAEASASKKTKKKKKKHKKKTPGDLAEKVLVSNQAEPTGEKVRRFEEALGKLYEGSNTPLAERESIADTALTIIFDFERAVDSAPGLRTMVPSATIQREMLDAARVVFLLDKFNAQLPDPRPTTTDILSQPSMLTRLNALSGPPDQIIFYSFFSFTFKIGVMLQCNELETRAEDVWRLLETRLLAIKQRGDEFTNLVGMYVDGRQKMQMHPIFGSTLAAQREFGRCMREYEVKQVRS